MNTAARQLLRALRGSQSQVGFSQALGYRSNVAAEWEAGRRSPHALELLRICESLNVDALSALAALAPSRAHALDPSNLGPWLDALRGGRPRTHIARRARRSRHQISRWLAGTAVPRVPDFLQLVDALTHRPATFVGSLVDIRLVPSLHRRLSAERDRAAHLARQSEAPVRQALRSVGVQPRSVLAIPLSAHDLPEALRLHDAHARALRALASSGGEPDSLAILGLGSAPLG